MIYQPYLQDHRRIRLTPCYDGLVHPRLASALVGDGSAAGAPDTMGAGPQGETGPPATTE